MGPTLDGRDGAAPALAPFVQAQAEEVRRPGEYYTLGGNCTVPMAQPGGGAWSGVPGGWRPLWRRPLFAKSPNFILASQTSGSCGGASEDTSAGQAKRTMSRHAERAARAAAAGEAGRGGGALPLRARGGAFTGYGGGRGGRASHGARRGPPGARAAALLPPDCPARRAAGLRAAAAASERLPARGRRRRGAFDRRRRAATGAPADPRAPRGGRLQQGAEHAAQLRPRLGGRRGRRAACCGPILDELERVVPRDGRSRVLVPGAGLARLVLEVAARGYGAQGNEDSTTCCLLEFLLNSGLRPGEVALYPRRPALELPAVAAAGARACPTSCRRRAARRRRRAGLQHGRGRVPGRVRDQREAWTPSRRQLLRGQGAGRADASPPSGACSSRAAPG